jgi:hypothetical protein
MRRVLPAVVLALTCGISLLGQAKAPAKTSAPLTDTITIEDQVDRLYPSLVPVHELKVVSPDRKRIKLTPAKTDYSVSVNGKVADNVLLGVRSVVDGVTGETNPEVVYLILRGRVFNKGDKVQVSFHQHASKEIKVSSATSVSLSLTPNFVQSEALTNGQKRPVGQLNVAFDELSLTSTTPFRTHLTTSSTFSSDAKDNSSNVNLLFGVERSLMRSWYLPWHTDTKMIGDQVIDNLSWVSSTGVTTIVPWGWTRSFLNNPVLDAPVSPEITLDAQIEHRIRRDAAAQKKFADKDAFRLHGSGSWTPIRLLKGDGNGDYVSLELAGQGWYLPHQHDFANVLKDRLEGYFQASVLVPVSKVAVSDTGLATAQKGTKTQIRVQYSLGANEANGFKHSSRLSIGVEATTSK